MTSLEGLLKAFSSASSSAQQSNSASTTSKSHSISRPRAWEELLKSIDCYRSNWAAADKGAFIAENSSEAPPQKSLAVLFIIIDDFPNEPLWKLWLRNAERESTNVRLYFHAKHPERVRSEFVRSRLVRSFQLRPEWGSIDLTKTMLLMLREAWSEDSSVQKFVFASESCVPLLPLQEVLHDIYADGISASWLCYRSSPNNGFAKQHQWDVLETNGLPQKSILKADQWLLLSRAHASWLFSFLRRILPEPASKDELPPFPLLPVSALLSHPIFRLFQSVRASDEVFFPSLLALMIPRGEDVTLDMAMEEVHVHRRRVSYCDWSQGARNPKTFHLLKQAEVRPALEEGCIFFRKLRLDIESSSKVEDLAEAEAAEIRGWWEKVYSSKPDLFDDRRLRKRQREEE